MSVTGGKRVASELSAEQMQDNAASAAKYGRRSWRFIPRNADSWSSILAIVFALLVPTWFFVANDWNPNYVPIRPWLWSYPWIIAFTYFMFQMLFLLKSAINSDRIGILDMGFSLLALLSVFGTTIVVIDRSEIGKFHIGGFQEHELAALLAVAFFELAFTAWVRFLVNRRTFAAVAGSHDNQ